MSELCLAPWVVQATLSNWWHTRQNNWIIVFLTEFRIPSFACALKQRIGIGKHFLYISKDFWDLGFKVEVLPNIEIWTLPCDSFQFILLTDFKFLCFCMYGLTDLWQTTPCCLPCHLWRTPFWDTSAEIPAVEMRQTWRHSAPQCFVSGTRRSCHDWSCWLSPT